MGIKWLFKRNNNGKPIMWGAELDVIKNVITVKYGIVGSKLREEEYRVSQKDGIKELNSRYNDKRKVGYIGFEDIKDDKCCSPVGNGEDIDILYNYLNIYLPHNLNNNNTGALLPMLAKTYNGNCWKKVPVMLGQYKINGLRCFITAYATNKIFYPYGLRFQSREGIYWESLGDLEEYILKELPEDFIKKMIDENIALDGELYIPGYSINQINHAVKDKDAATNRLIQFWCYDIVIENMKQEHRYTMLEDNLPYNKERICNLNAHMNNDKRFLYIPVHSISSDREAVMLRNDYISRGFEGLILRNPDAEYQFGRRRANFMEKFKDATDGYFTIINIIKEYKRDLPVIVCRNDINNAEFETRLVGSHEYQKGILDNKDKYIGKLLFVEFGERSGIEEVPFHIKRTKIILDE